MKIVLADVISDDGTFREDLKYKFRKRMRYIARLNGLSPTQAYQDMATCPICTQVEDKPAEEFTVREMEHIRKHLLNPVVEEIMDVHCVHHIHGFSWCCNCKTFVPARGGVTRLYGFTRGEQSIGNHSSETYPEVVPKK